MITVGSLFSGIGGLDLGLERAGMRVVWQSEIEPYCCKVLKKHWPTVPNLGDITKITEAPQVDLICGGFPCQDISNAGKRAGIEGERSSLWFEMCRIIRLVRPKYVLVENVAALLVRGMGRVLGDLAESGYDAEWSCIPAFRVGAPHQRERIFIIAYTNGDRCLFGLETSGLEGLRPLCEWDQKEYGFGEIYEACRTKRLGDFSAVPRMDDGIPDIVDRNHALGNAVVPQVAEWIGSRIIEADKFIQEYV